MASDCSNSACTECLQFLIGYQFSTGSYSFLFEVCQSQQSNPNLNFNQFSMCCPIFDLCVASRVFWYWGVLEHLLNYSPKCSVSALKLISVLVHPYSVLFPGMICSWVVLVILHACRCFLNDCLTISLLYICFYAFQYI